MPEYRRYLIPGSTVFLTIVSNNRVPRFSTPDSVQQLRDAVSEVAAEWPFEVTAAVILPDHMHFLWTLPLGDAAYPKRVGRMKAEFTRLSGGRPARVGSRALHRESTVWQRRFWEHTIRDEDDLKAHLDYIHFNPVKHGFARCPHEWAYSSFGKWVHRGEYASDWGCSCGGRTVDMARLDRVARNAGE